MKLMLVLLLACSITGLNCKKKNTEPVAADLRLTASSNIDITKSWSQQPNGYKYPINILVPDGAVPTGGFPVCILLHGNGGNGQGMINQFGGILQCHILIAPGGYQNSWNICAESSDAPDIEMINDLLEKLKAFSNVNPNKIRILGSSNGAGLANRVFIENNDPGIDIICAVVSQLNEPQFHSGNFYKPANGTIAGSPFCGYTTIASPLTTRKYLSINNDNDNIIPYQGGTSVVGVNFLPAETAAFNIAKLKGYTGGIMSSGVATGNPSITEFSYLARNVVHIKGSAAHGTDATQRNYIKNYFLDCK
jgi:poly(3-hydroxybutyrate) depolymerase